MKNGFIGASFAGWTMLISSVGAAQEAPSPEVEALKRILTEITGLRAEARELREEIAQYREAVIAFKGGCPAGWDEYRAAEGRFIVAAGAATDTNGVTRKFAHEDPAGGAYSHALQSKELPPHRHKVLDSGKKLAANDASNVTGIMRLIFDRKGASELFFETDDGPGKSTSFDTIPPYVVLSLCTRVGK